MTVEIAVLGPSTVPVNKNVYELVVKYMHGDANGYSTETMTFDTYKDDEVRFILYGLQFMKTKMTPHADIEQKKFEIRQFFEGQGYLPPEEDEDSDGFDDELVNEEVEDFIDNWLQMDTSDESYDYAATLKDIKLFYYNEDGTKFDAVMTINGENLA